MTLASLLTFGKSGASGGSSSSTCGWSPPARSSPEAGLQRSGAPAGRSQYYQGRAIVACHAATFATGTRSARLLIHAVDLRIRLSFCSVTSLTIYLRLGARVRPHDFGSHRATGRASQLRPTPPKDVIDHTPCSKGKLNLSPVETTQLGSLMTSG